MDENPKIGRRRFLRRVGATGALIVFAPLAGCGRGGEGGGDEGGGDGDGAAAGKVEEPARTDSDPCADTSELNAAQREFREDAGYVAETPNPGERCDNCAYWEAPRGGAACGGCTAIAGPIHPGGWCDLWEEQT